MMTITGSVVPRRSDPAAPANDLNDGPGKYKRDLYHTRFFQLNGVAPGEYPYSIMCGVMNCPVAGQALPRPIVTTTKKNMRFPDGQYLGGEHYGDGCFTQPMNQNPEPNDLVYYHWTGNKRENDHGAYTALFTPGHISELYCRGSVVAGSFKFINYMRLVPNSLVYLADGRPQARFVLLGGSNRAHFEANRELYP